jgi:hypothetical protein
MAIPTQVTQEAATHKYHITLTDGSERDLIAHGYSVEASGALSLFGAKDDKTVTYAPGVWTYIEQERKDDRG